jgi:hypothetical protein
LFDAVAIANSLFSSGLFEALKLAFPGRSVVQSDEALPVIQRLMEKRGSKLTGEQLVQVFQALVHLEQSKRTIAPRSSMEILAGSSGRVTISSGPNGRVSMTTGRSNISLERGADMQIGPGSKTKLED